MNLMISGIDAHRLRIIRCGRDPMSLFVIGDGSLFDFGLINAEDETVRNKISDFETVTISRHVCHRCPILNTTHIYIYIFFFLFFFLFCFSSFVIHDALV